MHLLLYQRDHTGFSFTVDYVMEDGFPLGACLTEAKAFEAKEAFMNGASEVDMVLNVGKFKSGDYDFVRDDIKAVVAAASTFNGTVKVILETCLLAHLGHGRDGALLGIDLAANGGVGNHLAVLVQNDCLGVGGTYVTTAEVFHVFIISLYV